MEQPVSFVDLPATLLSLADVPIPEHYEGRAFLGSQQAAPREHVFLFRGRMDERYDTVRAIRDTQFRYVRNYSPHRPWGQHYSYAFRVQPSMRSWYAAYQAGQCDDVQARYWQPKPSEELYDTAADPFEIRNLIDEPGHAARLADMRRTLRDGIIAIRDPGFINAYAGSTVCAPSRSVLMTGQHTGHTTVRGNTGRAGHGGVPCTGGGGGMRVPLRPDDVTVADVLKQVGMDNGASDSSYAGPARRVGRRRGSSGRAG